MSQRGVRLSFARLLSTACKFEEHGSRFAMHVHGMGLNCGLAFSSSLCARLIHILAWTRRSVSRTLNVVRQVKLKGDGDPLPHASVVISIFPSWARIDSSGPWSSWDPHFREKGMGRTNASPCRNLRRQRAQATPWNGWTASFFGSAWMERRFRANQENYQHVHATFAAGLMSWREDWKRTKACTLFPPRASLSQRASFPWRIDVSNPSLQDIDIISKSGSISLSGFVRSHLLPTGSDEDRPFGSSNRNRDRPRFKGDEIGFNSK